MHLLTFLTLKEKNHLLFRTLVISGQARPHARCLIRAGSATCVFQQPLCR